MDFPEAYTCYVMLSSLDESWETCNKHGKFARSKSDGSISVGAAIGGGMEETGDGQGWVCAKSMQMEEFQGL